MDHRKALSAGTTLTLGDTGYDIIECVGRGMNAMVYQAEYGDNLASSKKHTVLIKELFPYQKDGYIYRTDTGCVVCLPQWESRFELYRQNFMRGNAAQLELIGRDPSAGEANLNSYEANGTLYTVLGYDGGATLYEYLLSGEITTSLQTVAQCMLNVLDALEQFHSHGFLHLDVNPENILLIPLRPAQTESQRRTLLIDYNSVWTMDELRATSELYLSDNGNYAAPEVRLRERNALGFQSDLFSIAAIFYQCLMGKPPEYMDLVDRASLHIEDSQLLRGVPETVAQKAIAILRRGLTLPAKQRYADIAEMRADFTELSRRVTGAGVTHRALWEASRAGFQRALSDNPAYAHVRDEQKQLPLYARMGGDETPLWELLARLNASGSAHALLKAGGGMGKTTALYGLWRAGIEDYSPDKAVPVYIPLYEYNGSERFIRHALLERLKLNANELTYSDAAAALSQLLDEPLVGGRSPADRREPCATLLLDGLNEVSGDRNALVAELHTLMKKPGVRLLISSRSEAPELPIKQIELMPAHDCDVKTYLIDHNVKYPDSPQMCKLLTNVLMLSLYVKTTELREAPPDAQTRDALLAAYFDALMMAYKRGLPEDSPAIWQCEYAIEKLLPSIAGELERRGSLALSGARILAVTEKEYKSLKHGSARAAFPELASHVEEIRGGAHNAAEWFDEMIQAMLTRSLGLLIRNERGEYRLMHQELTEYLASRNKVNARRLRRKRLARGTVTAMTALALCAMLCFAYIRWIRPQPYNDTLVKTALENVMAQANISSQLLNDGNDLIDCVKQADDAKQYEEASAVHTESAEALASMSRSTLYMKMLDKMASTGSVIAGSNQPLDFETAKELIVEPDNIWARLIEMDAAFARTYVKDDELCTRKNELIDIYDDYLRLKAQEQYLLSIALLLPHEGYVDQTLYDFVTLSGGVALEVATTRPVGSAHEAKNLLPVVRGELQRLDGELAKLGLQSQLSTEG